MTQHPIADVIRRIIPFNNVYRDAASTIATKLRAMWDIGNVLHESDAKTPHKLGWDIQAATKGLIKRPTIFRSHKIRMIWSSREKMVQEIGRIRRLSHLIDILPLIDPAQEVRAKLTDGELEEIYRHACNDMPVAFRPYIEGIKKRFAHGRLGKPLNKGRHLDGTDECVAAFRRLGGCISMAMAAKEAKNREDLRRSIDQEERAAFANICIALTTKENHKLYRRLPPEESHSRHDLFCTLYNEFRALLEQAGDTRRARLRRLLPSEELAQMSDLLTSLQNEEMVEDYRRRKRISIRL